MFKILSNFAFYIDFLYTFVLDIIISILNKMNTNKKGQNVRFSSTLDDEELNQIYVVIDIYVDVYKVRCIVKAIHSGMTFPPTSTLKLDDLNFIDN